MPRHAASRSRTRDISPALLGFLALMAGATVANLYYNQALLTQIAHTFHVSPAVTGLVAVITQIGYALGLVLIVPLGDGQERKRLIVAMTSLIALSLVAVALSPTFIALLIACLFMGAATTVPQLLVPYTATLASPKRRGRVIGIVMGGLLVGVIASRSVSGFGAFLGWRTIFGLAAGLMAVFTVIAAFALSRQAPPARLSHKQLLGSLLSLWRTEPVLRLHAMLGALGFAAFSCFWTALIFHFKHLFPAKESVMVAIMGLFGVAGALAAPLSGHLSERFNAPRVNGAALFLVLLAFVVFWIGATSLPGLALGVVLLDAGVQASHISNQTRIYALAPEIRNRLTSLYMTAYFLGGAIGSFCGSALWEVGRWPLVCAAGASFAALALLRLAFSACTIRRNPPRA